MKCPACNVALVMSERKGIEIDYCPECRGVWLDRGELDKIIEKSNAEMEAPRPLPPPPQEQRYEDKRYEEKRYDDDKYKYKKKKGMLGDLFDF